VQIHQDPLSDRWSLKYNYRIEHRRIDVLLKVSNIHLVAVPIVVVVDFDHFN
jgi:hypothetical protein